MIIDAIKKNVDKSSLSSEEASQAMKEIMSGSATPSQMSAFLISLSMKGESTEEIIALAKTMKEFANRIRPAYDNRLIDIVGTGGDKIKTINLSTISAFVLASADVKVAKHGNRAATGKCGSADVLDRLGYKLDTKPKIVEECIEKKGIGFMFAPVFHPAMKNVIGTRKEIGVKTIFNILGPLTNPADVDSMIVGVANVGLIDKYAKILPELGCKRAIIVHGMDGLDEISTFGETKMRFIGDLENQGEEITVKPENFGLQKINAQDIAGTGIDYNAEIMFQILANRLEINDPKVEAVIANSSVGFIVAGKAASISEGVEKARETLVSGKCIDKLKEFIQFVNGDMERIEQFESI
ncbi:MAG: anthranilate phosphoribosyltransferase [Thaumarchaeota archaeon]|nr:anthranilate phosphoribosyltransferase [Nitrososphaerota archaeon]